MPIRVLRVIEYTYDSVESMERDMAGWTHGLKRWSTRITMRSVVLPLEVIPDDPPVLDGT